MNAGLQRRFASDPLENGAELVNAVRTGTAAAGSVSRIDLERRKA